MTDGLHIIKNSKPATPAIYAAYCANGKCATGYGRTALECAVAAMEAYLAWEYDICWWPVAGEYRKGIEPVTAPLFVEGRT